jgi:hypothetical protein
MPVISNLDFFYYDIYIFTLSWLFYLPPHFCMNKFNLYVFLLIFFIYRLLKNGFSILFWHIYSQLPPRLQMENFRLDTKTWTITIVWRYKYHNRRNPNLICVWLRHANILFSINDKVHWNVNGFYHIFSTYYVGFECLMWMLNWNLYYIHCITHHYFRGLPHTDMRSSKSGAIQGMH